MVAYYLLALAISYGLGFGLMAIWPALGSSGQINYLIVWGPALAALIAVAREGRRPLNWIVRQVRKSRVSIWLLAAPILLLGVALVAGAPFSTSDWLMLLLVQTALIALPEELGWRAYLQPRLLARFRPIVAFIIVGIGWAAWHGPKLFSLPALLPFALALSIVIGWLVAKHHIGWIGAAIVHGCANAGLYLANESADGSAVFSRATAMLCAVALLLALSDRRWLLNQPASD